MQLSLLLFLHNLLCFHLSRALGGCCLSLVPLCGSIPPAGPLHWFSSWQYPGIRVPVCHRLIHELGFKIHSFYSGGIFSEVLKSKPEGFQACFTSWSELKYFLYCSLVVSSFLQLFSYFFGILSIIFWTSGASTYIQRLSKNIRSLYVFFVSWVSNWPYFL